MRVVEFNRTKMAVPIELCGSFTDRFEMLGRKRSGNQPKPGPPAAAWSAPGFPSCLCVAMCRQIWTKASGVWALGGAADGVRARGYTVTKDGGRGTYAPLGQVAHCAGRVSVLDRKGPHRLAAPLLPRPRPLLAISTLEPRDPAATVRSRHPAHRAPRPHQLVGLLVRQPEHDAGGLRCPLVPAQPLLERFRAGGLPAAVRPALFHRPAAVRADRPARRIGGGGGGSWLVLGEEGGERGLLQPGWCVAASPAENLYRNRPVRPDLLLRRPDNLRLQAAATVSAGSWQAAAGGG